MLRSASRLLRAGSALQEARFQLAAEALCSTSGAPSRCFSAPADGGAGDQIGNDKVRKLADDITGLTVLECSWLSEILRKKLNLAKPAFGGMPMMPMMGAMGGAPAAGARLAPPPLLSPPPLARRSCPAARWRCRLPARAAPIASALSAAPSCGAAAGRGPSAAADG